MKSVAVLVAALWTLCFAQGAPAAETFEDTLLSTPTSPGVMAKGQETDGYQLGVSAYAWGYPLVRMERVVRQYTDVPSPKPATSYRGPLNQIGWASQLATPDAKDMPTANNDTYYMSAVVKLDRPYILSVPDTHDRYYVVNVFNMWQELEHYIGRRTTSTNAGRYAIVPPGWKGKLPAGVKRLDVTTDKVWLWGRLRIAQGEPTAPVLALQKQFRLEPLGGETAKDKGASLAPLPAISGDDLGFFTHLASALKDNAVKPADQALFAQFARIGLTAKGFDPSKMSEQTRKGLLRALEDAPAVVVSSLASTAVNRNGWTWATGLDSFGFNYPLRAMVAGSYLGGNGEKEAMYPLRSTDADGNLLSGANRYVIKFDREPPVNAFWSLTMYDDADKMLVANPIARYKVGTDTQGLVRASDGSITIPVQAEKPEAAAAANWLPAPKGNFYVILRLYQPSDAILNGAYQLPQMRKVQ
ncbi:DUF1254 domain-containing protein [Bosea sp. BIWAKO-01]|uniref:DUF1254 domain-containing protein n=1 Tax=Bosea sp. BIWAKO-01 TaxID=506668 RepID=UPI0008533629|nr:DUF1214 domain-containing protein [Bosea sp. BIWAKO-01]GAU85996.1 hypothetical protein BIWAKO_05944 [Bosea sp. BIWAKO-01]